MTEEMVAITKKEYDRLMDVDKFMDALDAVGVDNWEGYDMAWDYFSGEVEW